MPSLSGLMLHMAVQGRGNRSLAFVIGNFLSCQGSQEKAIVLNSLKAISFWSLPDHDSKVAVMLSKMMVSVCQMMNSQRMGVLSSLR